MSATPNTPRPAPDLGLLAILIAVTSIGPMALNIYLPSMPGLQRVFDVGYGTVQWTQSLYLIGLAAAQLIYGPLSDRFGRRPVLLAGMTLSLLGTLACALAPTIGLLVMGRLVQAVGACSGMVLARAMIRDLFPRDRAASVMGYVTMAMVVIPMVAPTIGGYLDKWFDWRASFFFVAAATLPVIVIAAWKLPETTSNRSSGGGGAREILAAWNLMAVPAFRRYALQVGFTTSVFFSFVTGAPYIMIELMDQPPHRYGLYVIMVALMYMSGNFATGRAAVRVGPDRMISWGTSLSLIGVLLADTALPLVLLMLLGAIGGFLVHATVGRRRS